MIIQIRQCYILRKLAFIWMSTLESQSISEICQHLNLQSFEISRSIPPLKSSNLIMLAVYQSSLASHPSAIVSPALAVPPVVLPNLLIHLLFKRDGARGPPARGGPCEDAAGPRQRARRWQSSPHGVQALPCPPSMVLTL